MERRPKYIDSKLLPKNKEKITVLITHNTYENIKIFSHLTGDNTTDIVNDALYEYFKNKTLTNDYLSRFGGLYFNLPLSKEFKSDAITNRIKLNQGRKNIESTEHITIKTVTNNLDVFNGVTYSANLEDKTINHCGIDFKIIPTAIDPNINEHVDLTDALYVFYYEVSNNHNINVYLINPIDAVNKLSYANHVLGKVLIECLQEMEFSQKEINKNYADEMQELYNNDENMSNSKKSAIKDKYTAILLDVLNEIESKYNNPNIIYGSDASSYNLKTLNEKIKALEKEHEITKRIIEHEKD